MNEKRGSYSTVTIYPNNQVHRRLRKYTIEKPRLVEYAAIMDLAMHKSIHATIGLPHITDCTITDDDIIEMTMPNYGVTLSTFLQDKTLVERRALCRPLLTQLARTCLVLHRNGYQHTDIKPANILVDPDGKLTLIDFNLISTKYGDTWGTSYGTWNYVAPEILQDEQPTDTSAVWSIGMILAYIVFGFPLDGYRQLSSNQRSSREFWVDTLSRLQKASPHHWPMPSIFHVALTHGDLKPLFKKCTLWDPKLRISLEDLYTDLADAPLPLQPPLFPQAPQASANQYRTSIWAKMRHYCHNLPPSVPVRAISLWDALDPPADLATSREWACGCLALAIMLNLQYIPDDLARTWDVDDAEAWMWFVGECLNWRVIWHLKESEQQKETCKRRSSIN
jgi:serine/threonine protein kinase